MGEGSFEKQKDISEPEKRKILVVGNDLTGLGLSPKDLAIILEKINELYREGKVATVEEARSLVPTLEPPELKISQRVERQKPPRHTKKKGEKY